MIRVGLRFSRVDALLLDTLAARVRNSELSGHHLATFTSAADAARTGEPLIIQCKDPIEAHVMADGYARLGCRRPFVEELTGHRPPK
jgi:hypothetical protein